MGNVFWGLLVLMLLLAIAIMVWPLLRVRKKQSIAYKESNLVLYQDKLGELDLDLDEGRIDQVGYRVAREELDRELLADVPEDSRESAAQNRAASASPQPALALLIAAFIPAVSFLMYLQLGMHAETEVFKQEQAMAQGELTMEEMVVVIENRLLTTGGDERSWTMLGKGYKSLKRYGESAKAFVKAVEMADKAGGANAALLLETAETIAYARNQRFDEPTRALVMRALEMEPDNLNALWFAAVANFQLGDYWNSVDQLSIMAEGTPPSEPVVLAAVAHYLDQAKTVLAGQGEDVSPIDEALQVIATKSSVKAKPVADPAVRRIVVQVDVADDIRQAFRPGDAVFVYARAQQGPKMPLAVQRMTLADLPATIGLDDTMAMVQGMNLSAFDRLDVFARISPAGTAITQSGDAIGQFALNAAGQSNEVDITIEKLVP